MWLSFDTCTHEVWKESPCHDPTSHSIFSHPQFAWCTLQVKISVLRQKEAKNAIQLFYASKFVNWYMLAIRPCCPFPYCAFLALGHPPACLLHIVLNVAVATEAGKVLDEQGVPASFLHGKAVHARSVDGPHTRESLFVLRFPNFPEPPQLGPAQILPCARPRLLLAHVLKDVGQPAR